MKRLMLVCMMILCLMMPGSQAENRKTMDQDEARSYACAVLSMSEIDCGNVDIQQMTLSRDDDCWICELADSANAQSRYCLIFDDSGMIHRFQDLSYDLPETIYADYEVPLSDEMNQFLIDANSLTTAWLSQTGGSGYDAFFLAQIVEPDVCLFSIEEMSRYVLVSRRNGAYVILAYGQLTASHGAYGNGITRDQAIETAGRATELQPEPSVLFAGFDGEKMCWNIVLCSQGFDRDFPNSGTFVSVHAHSGDVLRNEFLGSGVVPLYWEFAEE